MLIDNMKSEILERMYKDHHALMDEIQNILWDEEKKDEHQLYYNSQTHGHLMRHAWEILLPVSEDEWFRNLKNFERYDKNLPWPQFSFYQYSMDVVLPPNVSVSALYFGYAVLEDGTVKKCAFFQWMKIVEYQAMPQGVVMDPLAKLHNIKIKYYVGIPVDMKDLEDFLLRIPGIPLENYVKRKKEEEHQQRLHDSYMESYYLQMSYEPQYFPRKLIEFAEKNGLYITDGQKGSN